LKKIIIHTGMPKTATTTIQENILYKAYEQGLIYYLGRAHVKGEYYPVQDIIKSMLYMNDKDFAIHKKKIKLDLENIIDKIEHKLIVLSDEFLSLVSFRLGENHNPIRLADRSKCVFSKYNIEIVTIIRNQYEIVHSSYVQSYYIQEQFEQTDSFEKYLNFNIEHFPKSELLMFDYYTIISKYINLFSSEKVHILIYEDLMYNKDEFFNQFSKLFSLSRTFVEEGFKNNTNKKIKNKDGSYTNLIFVTRRFLDKKFLSSVENGNKFTLYVYDFYKRNIVIKKIFFYIYMQLFRYKKQVKPVFILKLDKIERERIKKLYGKGNQKISEIIGFDLTKYNYPI